MRYDICVFAASESRVVKWEPYVCCRMIIHGGWVPVVGEDGTLALSEKEWVCSNSLGIFNLGA
jgi:hypothetical protein